MRGLVVYSQTNQGAGNTGAADDLGALYLPFLCGKGTSSAELYAGPTKYGVTG